MLFGWGTSSPVRTRVAMAPGASRVAMSRVKIPRTGPASAAAASVTVSPLPPSDPLLRARKTTSPLPFTEGWL